MSPTKEKAALARAARSEPAGLTSLRSWSAHALAPLAAELEDFVDLLANDRGDRKRSEKRRATGAFEASCDSNAYDSESSSAEVPVVRRGARPAHRVPGHRVALRVRAALILAAFLGCTHTCRQWAGERRVQRQPLVVAEEATVAADAADRGYLKVGSVYQNEYMTLWNENGGPISVTLEVGEGDSFELKVDHLNSVNDGNLGWFVVRGGFRTEAMEAKEHMRRLVPEVPNDSDGKSFLYDPKVLDRACSIAYRIMERTGMLGVVELQVDVKEDTVLVTPRSSIVRIFWDEPVVLRLTTRENVWAPKDPEEAAGEKAASENAAGEKAASAEPASEDVSGEQPVSEDVSGEQPASEDVSGELPASEDVSGK
mmetsp:Transcript_18696/g.56109  ORF Transcript_18696/g.56109 Transcript_18696/m.56109 type:complete len:370 (+) Transcript_18696:73-1182(+)